MVRMNSNNEYFDMGEDEFKMEFDDGADFIIIENWLTASRFVADDEFYEAQKELLISRLEYAEMNDVVSESILAELDSLEPEAVIIGL
ncbi:hypothetical protein PGQ11_007572 [Apiospora arundinis]|uniref:Uncharacterized protein n=1 Tax=Apiospora arundinis TaxID=335852 RepID=A0ABR2IVY2_9PEZI